MKYRNNLETMNYGERNFKDSESFMVNEDGNIAFCTPRSTWLEVTKHGLDLDKYFYFQTHSPTISFDFKPSFRRCKKEKEGLNDDDRCESCKQPFDTITFQRKNEYTKEAVCSSCAIQSRINFFEMLKTVRSLENHLLEVNALLYRLDYNVSDYEVSVSYILPYLRLVMNNWEIGNCRSRIFKLRKISNSWPLTDINLINVLDVVIILRKMQDELKLNIKNICANRRSPFLV